MKSYTRYLFSLSFLISSANAQYGLDIAREFIPDRLLSDAEYRRQMSEVIEAKGAIRPDIIWDYILYLRALGSDEDRLRITELRANAYAVENTVRSHRAAWMQRQREHVKSKDIDDDLRHQVLLAFEQSGPLHGDAYLTDGAAVIDDDPRRHYIAWRWIDRQSAGPFEEGVQYKELYENACRKIRLGFADPGIVLRDHSPENIDKTIDSIFARWYVFDGADHAGITNAADIVFALKKSKLASVYGGSIVVSTGVTPINPEVFFSPTVHVIGFGPFSVDQSFASDGQWYMALRYKYTIKDYTSPLSYIAVDIMGSFGQSVIDHRSVFRKNNNYSINGRDYVERLTMEWNRIHVSGIQRILTSISIPLIVPFDDVVVEGGIVAGMQQYHVSIDYHYIYYKGERIPNYGPRGWYWTLYNENRTGTVEFDKMEYLFFPTAGITWRLFPPISVQANISTGVWLVRLGVDIF